MIETIICRFCCDEVEKIRAQKKDYCLDCELRICNIVINNFDVVKYAYPDTNTDVQK